MYKILVNKYVMDFELKYRSKKSPSEMNACFHFGRVGRLYMDAISESLYRYPIFLNLAIEGGQPDLEQAGGFGLVAAGIVEDFYYMAALHAFQV